VAIALALLKISPGRAFAQTTAETAPQWQGHSADYWIAKLRDGSLEERRDAAQAMASLTPDRPEVVPLLVAALRQRRDYELKNDAANALMRIGPRAQAAIPALIEALKAPDLEDNAIRDQAATALAEITTQRPEPLIVAFMTEENDAVLKGYLKTQRLSRIRWLRARRPGVAVANRAMCAASEVWSVTIQASGSRPRI
jgi:HEAT repeat protein